MDMHPEQPLHIVTKEVSGIWELIFFKTHIEYIDIDIYCMTLYLIVYKNQCQFIVVYKNELNLLCIPWMISQSPKAA